MLLTPISSHYIPKVGDKVIGKVVKMKQGHYVVDLGSSNFGVLPILDF